METRAIKKRSPYRKGAKQYLLSMELGEERIDDDRFNWRYLAQNACYLSRYSGTKFSFSSKDGINKIKRIK